MSDGFYYRIFSFCEALENERRKKGRQQNDKTNQVGKYFNGRRFNKNIFQNLCFIPLLLFLLFIPSHMLIHTFFCFIFVLRTSAKGMRNSARQIKSISFSFTCCYFWFRIIYLNIIFVFVWRQRTKQEKESQHFKY